MPGCTRLSGACGGSLARACVTEITSLQREQSTRTHAVYRASTSATPLCSTPPPPQQALDNRRSTWLAERRTLGGSAGADRGAKQRHDKLATGVHPVGLRMMLESMWPILPPLARAFQCGARSCTQPRFSATHPTIWRGRKEPRAFQQSAGGSPTFHPHGSHRWVGDGLRPASLASGRSPSSRTVRSGGARGPPEAPCAVQQCGNGAPAPLVSVSTDFPIKLG